MPQVGFYNMTSEMEREMAHLSEYIDLFTMVIFLQEHRVAPYMEGHEAYVRYRKSLGNRKPWNEDQ